ncbi:MAG TPA: hypothetical protein PKD77_05315 [Rudaea sp.]|jgi:hypothetical protein|nr:hypothetical protein [Rudaea sp.]
MRTYLSIHDAGHSPARRETLEYHRLAGAVAPKKIFLPEVKNA